MPPKDKNFIKESKKMKPIDFIYLGILFLFFISVIIVFFYSSTFIINNINKIFILSEGNGIQALNISNYSLTEKKLNLPLNTTEGQNQTIQPIIAPINPIIEIEEIVIPIIPILDKKSLTINILNTTSKKGVASVLSKSLEDAGFSTATTGNGKGNYPLTTILIKDIKKDYAESIEQVVKNLYPKAITKINPESSDYDVVIMISK